MAETLLAVIHDNELVRCQRLLKKRVVFFFSCSVETSGDNEFGRAYDLSGLSGLSGLNCPIFLRYPCTQRSTSIS